MDTEVTIQAVMNTSGEWVCKDCIFKDVNNCRPITNVLAILGLPDCFDGEGHYYIKKEK
jgi:hypothetical protein